MPNPSYGTPDRSASLDVNPAGETIADDGGDSAEPVEGAAPEDVNQVVSAEEEVVSDRDDVLAESDEEFLAELLARNIESRAGGRSRGAADSSTRSAVAAAGAADRPGSGS